jgi:hypothetical protein
MIWLLDLDLELILVSAVAFMFDGTRASPLPNICHVKCFFDDFLDRETPRENTACFRKPCS